MGFFSSRKPDNDYPQGEKTVVRVIRSRFYGKNKGKEREHIGGTFVDLASSAVQTLSQPSASHANDHVLSPTPQKNATANTRPPNSLSASKPTTPSVRSTSARSTKENHNTIATPTPRKPVDNATVTLAQRLNELATANSDGLLNDDEYRMLRQNLFERFASTSVVPSESSVVPATSRPQAQGSEARMSTSSRPASNFVVEVNRSPSVKSKGSVSSFFRRSSTTNLRRTPAGSKDFSDTSSVFSSTSGTSNIFKLPSRLTKKLSNSSMASARTEASRPADTISIASRRTGSHSVDRSEFHSLPHSSSGARSIASSIRRYATPPSSFPGARVLATDAKYTGHVQDVFDEENLKDSGEIKQELASVEAERKRLMDAFNGLELSMLTKRNRQTKVLDDDRESSTLTLIPGQRRVDSDATSVRSGTSMSTSFTGRRVVRQKTSSSLATMPSKAGSLHRKNSGSSMSSGRGLLPTSATAPPPVPSLPSGLSIGVGFSGSTSSINLTRSTGHLPMSSVPEDQVKAGHSPHESVMDHELEQEMDDIRRRREEVSMRYEVRLEYLRAKLKGAQLHEKLMRK